MKLTMKYELPELPDETTGEIRDIVRFIRKNAHPDLIILFGKYAAGTMQSVMGGYEFLIVSAKGEAVNIPALNELLERDYHRLERREPNIFLHSTTMNRINTYGRSSYFYYMIRHEGVVLHDNGLCANLFTGAAFRATQAADAAASRFDLYYSQGTALLDQAQKLWDAELPRQAALLLAYAADCFFRTAESIRYGHVSRSGGLKVCYMLTRHLSLRLASVFDLTFYENRGLFDDLDYYRERAFDDPAFSFAKRKYNRTLEKVKTLQQIVCTTCREHIQMLEKCRNREIILTPQKEKTPHPEPMPNALNIEV